MKWNDKMTKNFFDLQIRTLHQKKVISNYENSILSISDTNHLLLPDQDDFQSCKI